MYINKFSWGFVFLLLLGITSGCGNAMKLQHLESQLEQAQTELTSLKQLQQKPVSANKINNNPQLVHLVYFQLKEGATKSTQQQLIEEIKTLAAIDVLQDLEVGTFQELGDQRAMDQFGVMMQMRFNSEADYKIYQTHPIHLQLREKVKSILGGPPVTYDYWSQ